VDKAKSIGINWWENDPFLTATEFKKLVQENEVLKQRILSLESKSE
jgi:hypothetical protein